MRGRAIFSRTRVDAFNASFHKIGEIIPVLRQPSVGPHHSVDDFISDLHHVRKNARIAERLRRLLRVFEDRFHQFRVRHAYPSLGRKLFAGIGPGIRVVVVQQKVIAKFLGGLGQRDGVLEIVG